MLSKSFHEKKQRKRSESFIDFGSALKAFKKIMENERKAHNKGCKGSNILIEENIT